jgi:hypothetical protein
MSTKVKSEDFGPCTNCGKTVTESSDDAAFGLRVDPGGNTILLVAVCDQDCWTQLVAKGWRAPTPAEIEHAKAQRAQKRAKRSPFKHSRWTPPKLP